MEQASLSERAIGHHQTIIITTISIIIATQNRTKQHCQHQRNIYDKALQVVTFDSCNSPDKKKSENLSTGHGTRLT